MISHASWSGAGVSWVQGTAAKTSALGEGYRETSKVRIPTEADWILKVNLGLVAVLLLVVSMGGGGGQTDAKSSSKVTVVQSTRDIPAHNIIQVEDVIEKQVNSENGARDASIRSAKSLAKSYRIPLTSAQTLVASQVEQPGLRNDIAVGKRAIAIPVDERTCSLVSFKIATTSTLFSMRGSTRFASCRQILLLSPKTSHRTNSTPKTKTIVVKIATKQTTRITTAGTRRHCERPDHCGFRLDLKCPSIPAVGDAGSKLFVRDDIGDNQQLEPLGKGHGSGRQGSSGGSAVSRMERMDSQGGSWWSIQVNQSAPRAHHGR